jgi:hypothetical protein
MHNKKILIPVFVLAFVIGFSGVLYKLNNPNSKSRGVASVDDDTDVIQVTTDDGLSDFTAPPDEVVNTAAEAVTDEVAEANERPSGDTAQEVAQPPVIVFDAKVSFARMWNWVLKSSSESRAKENPVLAIAKCRFDSNKIIRAAGVRNTTLQQQIDAAENTVVATYGSDREYIVGATSLVTASRGKTVIANELIANCVNTLKRQAANESGRISLQDVFLGQSVTLENLEPELLESLNLKQHFEPAIVQSSVGGSEESGIGSSIYGTMGHSLNLIDMQFTNQQKTNIKENLLAAGSCVVARQGEQMHLPGGPDTLVLCPRAQELERSIASRERWDGLRLAASFMACGVGRRLSGGGFTEIRELIPISGRITAAALCGLTEAISGCDNLLTTVRNVGYFGMLTWAADALPNGSGLKSLGETYFDRSLAFLSGGRDVNNRGDNLAGAAIGAFATGTITGAIYDLQTGSRTQTSALGATYLVGYLGPAHLADDQLRIGGIGASEISEVVTGGAPGLIRAQQNSKRCLRTMRDELSYFYMNHSRDMTVRHAVRSVASQ